MSNGGGVIGGFAKAKLQKQLLIWGLSSTGILIVLGLLLLLVIITIIAGSQFAQDYPGGGSLSVSEQVLRYRPFVKEECEKDGIPAKVNVILAIIMQESGGNSLDVMQASESQGFPPNTIRNPRRSIKIGVKYFATVYHQAEKASHKVLQTALQGYNYGSGYVGWAIEHGGGYSKQNAIEFAKIHSGGSKRSNGTYSYGDQSYVQHVIRYLSAGNGKNNNPGAPVANQAINRAISLGESYIGHSTYVFGAGRNQEDIEKGYFDCSSFIHYIFKQAGITVGITTDQIVNDGKHISISEARRGDLIFFDTYKKNGHVGILEGDGTFLNCASSNGVTISSLSNSYWKSRFNGVIVRVTD